jgi:hypothetical protein
MMWRHSLGSEEWESLNDVHRRNIGGMLFCVCGPEHKVLGTILKIQRWVATPNQISK